MKECTRIEYAVIRIYLGKPNSNKEGSFSKDEDGIITLTLRDRILPISPVKTDFLNIEGKGTIPLERKLEVIADSISESFWKVYGIYNPENDKCYYNNHDKNATSLIEDKQLKKR